MKNNMKPLYVAIDRFEGDKAVLILPDGQNLVVSRQSLGQNLKAGDYVEINFSYSKKQTLLKQKVAQKLLNKLKAK